jgi:selenocysteine-specific elongation factor
VAEPSTQAERYLVLGTAGHIDHGKTSLIRALTGIDCDTLEEEKQRGITINLGFAHLELADGTQLGIVDVPGHARFIRNMVAGAAGIDIVMLVVAADDGVMPQTREHIAIAQLLGVKTGLVALNKADLVDADLLELAQADVEDLLRGTFLAGCPIIPVSAVTGQGLDELKATLQTLAAAVPMRASVGYFRMPVDRSFSVKGAGTVVTGTTLSGQVKLDDELELLPGKRKARVRGLQVHGATVTSSGPGHRTAINLAGIDKDDISRGNVLITPATLEPTYMLDVQAEMLAGSYTPLSYGSEVLLHIGTEELAAKCYPLDSEQALPGERLLAQLRFGQELAVAAGDRFILRSSEGDATIGGGRVLDAHPLKHVRNKQHVAIRLTDLAATSGDLAAAVQYEISKAQYGVERVKLQRLLNLGDTALIAVLAELKSSEAGLVEARAGQQTILLLKPQQERITKTCLQAINEYHTANPLLKRGLGLNELEKYLKSKNAVVPSAAIAQCLDAEVTAGRLISVGQTYALPRPEPSLSPKDQRALAVLRVKLNESAAPPQPEDFTSELEVQRPRIKLLLDYLEERGEIVFTEGLYFGHEIVERCEHYLRLHFKQADGISVSDFNQLTGSSRKYGMPLLRHFEQTGLLKRDGDVRRLA